MKWGAEPQDEMQRTPNEMGCRILGMKCSVPQMKWGVGALE